VCIDFCEDDGCTSTFLSKSYADQAIVNDPAIQTSGDNNEKIKISTSNGRKLSIQSMTIALPHGKLITDHVVTEASLAVPIVASLLLHDFLAPARSEAELFSSSSATTTQKGNDNHVDLIIPHQLSCPRSQHRTTSVSDVVHITVPSCEINAFGSKPYYSSSIYIPPLLHSNHSADVLSKVASHDHHQDKMNIIGLFESNFEFNGTSLAYEYRLRDDSGRPVNLQHISNIPVKSHLASGLVTSHLTSGPVTSYLASGRATTAAAILKKRFLAPSEDGQISQPGQPIVSPWDTASSLKQRVWLKGPVSSMGTPILKSLTTVISNAPAKEVFSSLETLLSRSTVPLRSVVTTREQIPVTNAALSWGSIQFRAPRPSWGIMQSKWSSVTRNHPVLSTDYSSSGRQDTNYKVTSSTVTSSGKEIGSRVIFPTRSRVTKSSSARVSESELPSVFPPKSKGQLKPAARLTTTSATNMTKTNTKNNIATAVVKSVFF